ncbi:unnamed protein product [Malus baccata var. baccata]
MTSFDSTSVPECNLYWYELFFAFANTDKYNRATKKNQSHISYKTINAARRARVCVGGELPGEVISHIFSYLPTKCVVKTDILSTGRKDLWASVPNLDFCTNDFSDIAPFLCLRCWSGRQGCSHSIDGWIDLRRVVELDLDVIKYADELPKSLFVCKTLMKLKLRTDFIINIPTTGCFPSLKFLHVTIYLPDKDSMCKLFSCCPVLEDLKTEGDLYPFLIIEKMMTFKAISLCFSTFQHLN